MDPHGNDQDTPSGQVELCVVVATTADELTPGKAYSAGTEAQRAAQSLMRAGWRRGAAQTSYQPGRRPRMQRMADVLLVVSPAGMKVISGQTRRQGATQHLNLNPGWKLEGGNWHVQGDIIALAGSPE